MNILIIGYFGYKNNQIDGQTIKTRQVYELIKERMPDYEVRFIDTQELQSSKFKTLFRLVYLSMKANYVVYLPGQNNLSNFFPILYRLSKLFRFKIIYPVVGGWLSDYLTNKPKLSRSLKNISAILVESETLESQLKLNYGFSNVEQLTNFRITDFTPSIKNHEEVKFVFMARVCPEKGCDYILNFARCYNKAPDRNKCAITFYGPIASEYRTSFFNQIKQLPNVRYEGVIEPQNVYKTLNEYDCMLLPSYYEGEGFPGSIVDSFIAGIPVVTTNWKALGSFIREGETGFIVSVHDQESLNNCLESIINNPTNLTHMKEHCIKEAKRYSAETAWKILSSYLNK